MSICQICSALGLTSERFRCLSQTNSHRPVNVTKLVLKELLTMHDVNEEFLEVLGGFHWKDITVEEALGTPFWTTYSKEKDQLGKKEYHGATGK
jgi:hypothetical protein